jgi:hypothetical protein
LKVKDIRGWISITEFDWDSGQRQAGGGLRNFA